MMTNEVDPLDASGEDVRHSYSEPALHCLTPPEQ